MPTERVITGIDIIEIRRIRDAVERWRAKFLERIFTPAELEVYGKKLESLAVRFAGKEAVMKALGALETNISWQEIEILSDPKGKPVVTLTGKAQETMHKLGVDLLEITLSHSRDNAVALVIGLRER